MDNKINEVKAGAKKVEQTAAFINKIATNASNNASKKYDFSWHGGASAKFDKGKNSSESFSGTKGGFGQNSGSFKSRSFGQENGTFNGGSGSFTSSKTSTTSTPTPASASKTAPGQNPAKGGVFTHGGNLASYTDNKFSANKTGGGGKFGAGSVVADGSYRASFGSKASVATNQPESRKIQTGAYTRRTGRWDSARDIGYAAGNLLKTPYEQSDAYQGYRKAKTQATQFTRMTGVSSIAQSVVRGTKSTFLKTELYSPKFEVSNLNLENIGGKDRSVKYIVAPTSFSARKDFLNNKYVIEDHFKDLNLDVRSLDVVRINRLIKGETIGIGNKKYNLANESDRLALGEYKRLIGIDKRLGGVTSSTRPFTGLRNTGKAWVNAAMQESDAGEGMKIANSYYKAGKVSIKAGVTTAKVAMAAEMQMAGGLTSVAGSSARIVSKIGYSMARNPISKAKWASISNIGDSLKKSAKVMQNGAGRIVKFSTKDKIRNAKYRVINKATNAILEKSAKARAIKELKKRLDQIRNRIINSAIVKAITAPLKTLYEVFVGIKKFIWIGIGILLLGFLLIAVASTICASLLVKDAQYVGEEVLEDTVLQQAIDYIYGWQNSYEYNLYCCDADLPIEERAIDEFSGEYHYTRGLPEKWKEQMNAWLNNGTDAEKEKDDYNITAIYERDADGNLTDNLVGYNMLHYWGPESCIYKYNALKYGAETSTGCNAGFKYFTFREVHEKDENGNEIEGSPVIAYELVANDRLTYQIRGIGSLEKDAGVFTESPPTTETHTPQVKHDTEAYQYNGEKQNTDSSIRYIYRGSEYSWKYTKNKSLYFKHVMEDELPTDYSMSTFYKNMVAVATAYTGNMEEPEGGFYKDYMWVLFDQNCNGKYQKGTKNEYNERVYASGLQEEDEDDAVPTYAKISIRAKRRNYEENPADDPSFFEYDNSEEAGNRPNIYIARGGSGISSGEGKAVGSWEESAIRWIYADQNLEDAMDYEHNGLPVQNRGDVDWYRLNGYLEQRCWARSCETLPEISISFFYTGVQDMFYLLDANEVVDNEWTHK